MNVASSDQVISLAIFHLEVGHRYTLTVTNATGAYNLEFLHGTDRTNWRVDPTVSGTVTAGVSKVSFVAVSFNYRLNFAAPPGNVMQITCFADAVSTF